MTSEIFTLEIPGTPVPKARPRFTRHGRAYTPRSTRQYEDDLRILARQRRGADKPFDGPLHVEVTAYFSPPQSWPKWKKDRVTGHGTFIACTVKPDIDNLGKIIDGLNGIVWHDDAQITDMRIAKRYSLKPRLIIVVRHDQAAIHSKTARDPFGARRRQA